MKTNTYTPAETALHQATAARLSIPLEELRQLAVIACIEAIAAHLDEGNKVELPLRVELPASDPIPFPDMKQARKLFAPAVIDRTLALAKKSGWSLRAIRIFAISLGIQHLEEKGSQLLGISPSGH